MLKELLEKYNQLNIDSIEAVEKDDVEKLNILLEEKDVIIEKIDNLNYTLDEFKKYAQEIDLINVENQLERIIREKQKEIKEKIKSTAINKSAVGAYGNISSTNVSMLNKRI
ncbi:hypothetical protein KQI30_00700 [Clostridium bornimense]|uniref:hypothetical protein n=1 Tax=Clostridium bornimense TaxID=1216932 RepID=UPI001C10AB6B|nr:hypothetical protein [Clostridium bornimense]MBU5314801.1 hypothetical protein [Clostridium bornimense]